MRPACTLALALITGCLAEQVAGPVATMASPRAERIEIRETRTLSGSVGLVVDGIAFGWWPRDSARLVALKPDDIENIEIIKGPAASQLYPAFHCSAIVIVTTKCSTPERRADRSQAAPGCMIIPSASQARH